MTCYSTRIPHELHFHPNFITPINPIKLLYIQNVYIHSPIQMSHENVSFYVEGLEKTRNVKILTLGGAGARQLPKYDWPVRLVYQTPGAHGIIEKEGVIMDDESQKLITKSETHVVVVRPKAYTSSSGTTWANETHRLRCEYPDDHEVKPGPDNQ